MKAFEIAVLTALVVQLYKGLVRLGRGGPPQHPTLRRDRRDALLALGGRGGPHDHGRNDRRSHERAVRRDPVLQPHRHVRRRGLAPRRRPSGRALEPHHGRESRVGRRTSASSSSSSATRRSRSWWARSSAWPPRSCGTTGSPSEHGRGTDPRMKLLSAIESPADLRQLPLETLPLVAQELRDFLVETVSRHGRPPGADPGRGRADARAPPRVRHAARPHRVGRRPPGLRPQDPDRAARPLRHAAPARRHLGLPAPRRERVRHVRHRARLDLDLGRARHGRRARPRRRRLQAWSP